MNGDLIIESVRQYFGSKHYVHSGAFWGAIGSLACFVVMLTSVPGSQPRDPIQYEHVVLVGVGFSLLSLIGTLLRNTTLRGSLPEPLKPKRPPKPPRDTPKDEASAAQQAPLSPPTGDADAPGGLVLN